MPRSLSKSYLRRLRNDLPIRDVIADVLDVTWKISEGRFRFLCPRCQEFHTGTNPETNLARCFACQRNFNPIDFTMVHKRYDFLQAVAFLDPYLPSTDALTPAGPTHQSPKQGHSIRDA
jgi:DNA primase